MFSTRYIGRAFRHLTNVFSTNSTVRRQLKMNVLTALQKLGSKIIHGVDWVGSIGRQISRATKSIAKKFGIENLGFKYVSKKVAENVLDTVIISSVATIVSSVLLDSSVSKYVREKVKQAAVATAGFFALATSRAYGVYNDAVCFADKGIDSILDSCMIRERVNRQAAGSLWGLRAAYGVMTVAALIVVWTIGTPVSTLASATVLSSGLLVAVCAGAYGVFGWRAFKRRVLIDPVAKVEGESLAGHFARRHPIMAALFTFVVTRFMEYIGVSLMFQTDNVLLNVLGACLTFVGATAGTIALVDLICLSLVLLLHLDQRYSISARVSERTAKLRTAVSDAATKTKDAASGVLEEAKILAVELQDDAAALVDTLAGAEGESPIEDPADPDVGMMSGKRRRRIQRRLGTEPGTA